jgi:hypothetical protein
MDTTRSSVNLKRGRGMCKNPVETKCIIGSLSAPGHDEKYSSRANCVRCSFSSGSFDPDVFPESAFAAPALRRIFCGISQPFRCDLRPLTMVVRTGAKSCERRLESSSSPSANFVVSNFLLSDVTGQRSRRSAGLSQRSSGLPRLRPPPPAFSIGGFSLDLWTAGIRYGFSICLKMRSVFVSCNPYDSKYNLAGESARPPTHALICFAILTA